MQGERRTRKDEHREAGSNTLSIGGDGYNFLASSLTQRSFFEATMNLGVDLLGYDTSFFSLLDSEQKQLQCIRDLYEILKAQSAEPLKERNWPADTQPWQIILWLLRKLGPYACGYDWHIDTYKTGRWEHFQFVVCRNYPLQQVSRYIYHGFMGTQQFAVDMDCFIPLDFLPELRGRDEALFNIIVDTVALVSKVNNVPLWDADGDFSGALQELKYNIPAYEKLYTIYSELAREYLNLINARKKTITVRRLINASKKYIWNSQRKYYIRSWVMCALRLTRNKVCINDHAYIPSYCNGAVTPFRMYKFIWCDSNNDQVYNAAKRSISKDENKHGCYLPVMFAKTMPGEEISLPESDDFPIDLCDFMKEGVKIFTIRYEQYFYKNRRREGLTPSDYWYYGGRKSTNSKDEQKKR